MEKVSIIVITYNAEENIEECLNSLINLDYNKDDYEILVVDASTDNTSKIVENFNKAKLIKSEKGYGIQRNLGIKNSRFSLICFIDSDCAAPKDWLLKMTKYIKDYDCVGGSIKSPLDSSLFGRCVTALGFPAGGSLGIDLFGNLSTCNSIFKKDVFNKSGYFNESLVFGGEDSELMERVKKNNLRVKLTNDSFIYHKPREFMDFLSWNFRRGKAKYYLYKNPLHLFSVFGVFVYPFTNKFRILIKKRNEINLDLLSIFTIVIFLFFLRQVFMTFGWIYGIRQSIRK